MDVRETGPATPSDPHNGTAEIETPNPSSAAAALTKWRCQESWAATSPSSGRQPRPAERSGVGAALIMALRFVGSTMGVAVLGVDRAPNVRTRIRPSFGSSSPDGQREPGLRGRRTLGFTLMRVPERPPATHLRWTTDESQGPAANFSEVLSVAVGSRRAADRFL